VPLRASMKLHQMRGNRLVTGPAQEPVTRRELKAQLRITHTNEDDLLDDLIADARQELEDTTGLAFITQVWRLTLDHWPCADERWWDGVRQTAMSEVYAGRALGDLTIPRYPLVSVDSVTVYDEGGTPTTVTVADVFNVDTQRVRGRLTLQRGATWPVALRANNAIEIVYTAGYGADSTEVPAPLKRAVRQMAAYMYEHRGDGCEPKDAYTASGAAAVLTRYRSIEV